MLKRVILCIFAWVPFILILLVSTVPCCIFLTYRIFVINILKPVFRRNFIAAVNTADYHFVLNSFFQGGRGAIGFAHVLENPLSVPLLIERLSTALFGKEGSKNAVKHFERLTSMYPTFWLGYPFWVRCSTKLDVKNHLVLKEKEIIAHDVQGVIGDWLYSPFRLNQPLWDCILLKDSDEKCHFAFRIHHIVGDGCSVLNFLSKIFDKESTYVPLTVTHPLTSTDKFKMCFWMPLTFAKHCYDVWIHSDYFSGKKRNEKVFLAKTSVNLSDLKAIRSRLSKKFGTPVPLFNTILLIFGSALRKAHLAGEFGEGKGLHKNISAVVGLPRSTPHPQETFCNHWNPAVYEIQVAQELSNKEIADTVDQLRWQSESKTSEAVRLMHHFDKIMPRWFFNIIGNNMRSTTAAFSNLPGSQVPVKIGSNKVTEINFLYGLQVRHASFTITTFSYNNEVSVVLVANEECLSRKEGAVLLEKFFAEEIKIFHADLVGGLDVLSYIRNL